MKQTITKILCDCCGKELTGNEGTSQFREEYVGLIKINNHQDGKEYKDFCFACNDKLVSEIWFLLSENRENTH